MADVPQRPRQLRQAIEVRKLKQPGLGEGGEVLPQPALLNQRPQPERARRRQPHTVMNHAHRVDGQGHKLAAPTRKGGHSTCFIQGQKSGLANGIRRRDRRLGRSARFLSNRLLRSYAVA